MKLKIKMAFTDKNTGEKYHVGDVKDFEEKRANELLADSRNIAEKVDEPEQAPAKEKPKAKRVKK